MSNRIKLAVVAPRSREEMELLVGQIAELKITERMAKASMDQKVKDVKDHYAAKLSDITEKLAALLPRAQAWADEHPEAFAGKSVQMLHGTIGWRLNNPSLKTLAGWTWDRVLEKLKSATAWAGFIRVKEEVDKQLIIANRDNFFDGDLRQIGVRIVQQEEFYVEPKLTDTPARETVSA